MPTRDDHEYYLKNKEKKKAQALEYYYNHKERVIKRIVEYNRQHKDKKREWNNKDRARVRAELIELLGGICFVCGTTKRLEIDHKQGGGTKDRIEKGNNHEMYRYYLKHPIEAKQKLQLLCKPHNLEKEFRNHESNPLTTTTTILTGGQTTLI